MAVTDYAVHVTTSSLDSTGAHIAERLSGPVLQQVQVISGICNAAEFDQNDPAGTPLSERKVFGDATDQAILRFSEGISSVAAARDSWKVLYTLGFDSKNKFMIKIIKPSNNEAAGICLSSDEANKVNSDNM